MSHIEIRNRPASAARLARRQQALSLGTVNDRLDLALEAEATALAYMIVAIAALLLAIALVAWAVFA